MRIVAAVDNLYYAGKSHRCGEVFDASDKDAKVLKLLNRAIDAPPPIQEPPRRQYRRRDMVAEDS